MITLNLRKILAALALLLIPYTALAQDIPNTPIYMISGVICDTPQQVKDIINLREKQPQADLSLEGCGFLTRPSLVFVFFQETYETQEATYTLVNYVFAEGMSQFGVFKMKKHINL